MDTTFSLISYKKNIAYRMHDNLFLEITDAEIAQKLSDSINPEDLHKVLDFLARRYCPVADRLELSDTWTVQQVECATDIMFKHPEDLAHLYDEILMLPEHNTPIQQQRAAQTS